MKFLLGRIFLPLLLLTTVSVVGAWAFDDNLIGLFYDTDASIHEVEVSANSTHLLYLVLLNPVNEDYDGGSVRDVEYVSGFECAILHPSGDVLLGMTFPTEGLNLGTPENIVAGFATAVPVTSQRVAVLATLSVLTMGDNPEGYRLVPTEAPSHPNTMAYVDSEDPDGEVPDPEVDNIVDMMPTSGSFDRPVFTFGDYTVDETAKWGEVKALYR